MCYCFHNNVRDCQLIHYRLFILVSLYEIWLEIWAIPHTTLAKTASNISSEFYARDSSVARQNTVERPINFLCKRFVICSTSLDLIFWCGPESSSTSSSTSSLAAHILVLSLCMAKAKRGDDGGR
jgi:hypothetical protein